METEHDDHAEHSEAAVHNIKGAKVCKQASYTIYTELDALYKAAKDADTDSITISIDMLKSMRQHAKEINRGISHFTQTVCAEYFRMGMEQNLIKHEMHADILDREAAFTETLETISDATQESTIATSLASAMRIVNNSHVAMMTLKEDAVFESAAVEACIRIRDAM